MKEATEKFVSRAALLVAVVMSSAAAYKAFMPARIKIDAETAAVLALADSAVLIGSTKARSTVVLATDHNCPYCAQMRESLSFAMSQDSTRLNVRLIPFPLTALHPAAEKSARAFVCASKNGRATEIDSLLFVLGAEISELQTSEVALRLNIGTAVSLFTACMHSPQSQLDVDRYVRVVRSAGVNSTPTMWVNGRRYSGLMPIDSLVGTRE